MDGTREPVVVTLAEKLTGNHSATGAKADAKTNCELRKGQRGLNAAKRDLATELPDDIRVDKGIGLLEEGTEENGYAKGKKLTPNDTPCDVDRTIPGTFYHILPHPRSTAAIRAYGNNMGTATLRLLSEGRIPQTTLH